MLKNKKQHPKIKFCGITTLQDARFASGALVDYLGFIFYEKSPRYLDPAKAGAIINWIEGPEFVGVFVNQPLDDVNMISRQTGIDFVQLHGNESPDYCQLVDKAVIKAIHVTEGDTASDLRSRIEPYIHSIDYLLFDTKIKGRWGGTGQSFDWSLIENVAKDVPFFLSGGLSVENIRSACKTVRPYAIDVSSGIEMKPGVKDYDKIEAFMEEISSYES